MFVLRAVVAVVVGFASTLISFAAFYVRGDLGAVFTYLGARGDARRLAEAGGSPAELQAAAAKVHILADAAAHPDFAVQMLPVCLVIGALLGYGAWRFFGGREQRAKKTDVQERMLMRYAYRGGGRFDMSSLLAGSPLDESQARSLIRRLENEGKLQRVEGGWELIR